MTQTCHHTSSQVSAWPWPGPGLAMLLWPRERSPAASLEWPLLLMAWGEQCGPPPPAGARWDGHGMCSPWAPLMYCACMHNSSTCSRILQLKGTELEASPARHMQLCTGTDSASPLTLYGEEKRKTSRTAVRYSLAPVPDGPCLQGHQLVPYGAASPSTPRPHPAALHLGQLH